MLKKIGREKAQYHILANLPYLTKEEIKNSTSLKMEPKTALDGGKDGLKFYQELFKQISQIKKDNSFFIYAEINPWQKDKLLELTKKAFSECSIEYETILDLRKEARIIIIKI
jgi:release factor glutamine methyltransferase